MEQKRTREVLDEFLACHSTPALKQVLLGLGDSQEIGLDVPFGPDHLIWRAYGDNPSNVSSVGLGTKPGRSLTERLTNAMDALLEERVIDGVEPPTSPREAAKTWFGRPISGPDEGISGWNYAASAVDRRIHVVLNSSDQDEAPSIDVLDDGIGLLPSQFANTILSLQAGNKIRKRYQIGAFGQGGAATLGFSEYVFIASRSNKDPAILGFTVIRVLRLDATYKEDCYAYLSSGDADGSVLHCNVGSDPLAPYTASKAVKAPLFEKGTLVRHINFRLTNLSKSLSPSPGNLWHFLHFSMFDPLLPFRLLDLRKDKERNELVSGSRNRLLKLGRKTTPDSDFEDERRVQIKHYRAMEFVTPHGAFEPSIGVEYWVVFAFKKAKDGGQELRGHSNELFIQTGHPIVGTLNGQNQGELTSHLLRDIGLSLVCRHMVVHIDATLADSRVRRELFSTNREGFKDGPVLDGLIRTLGRIFEDDENLFAIEKELTEKLTRRESEATEQEVKQAVTRLLKEAGLQVREEGTTDVSGSGQKRVVTRTGGAKPQNADPLPTLPFPEATKLKIVYPTQLLEVHVGDSQVLIVETDADSEFDSRGHVHIRADPPALEVATKAPLRGGRIRWRMRPKEGVVAGASGTLIVGLTMPDGSQLTDSIAYDVLPLQEKEAKRSSGYVPPFEILPICPDDQGWSTVWPDDLDDADAQALHAYKHMNLGGKVVVYYSTVFTPFKELVDRLKVTNPSRLQLFQTNYQVWIAYHAILQSQAKYDPHAYVDEEACESELERDRRTVARVQIKQALQIAELMEKIALRAEA